MYHYLSAPPSGADAIRTDLSVSPALFESHLAYLRQAGYETISLSQLSYALSQESDLPANPIVITFDDGYRDNYQHAFPLLRKYGYSATVFVFTQVIDTNNVNYLSWEMVKEMHQGGMEFGSHSYRHSDLRGRDVDFLVYEILGSKEAIEERTQEPVRFFSYPSGRYDELAIRVLESANFWGAVTTQWGARQSFEARFEMPRIRVRGNDTADDLAEKLNLFID
jgi:peptidoglycan/xylan/chitin deacetylase (PgdA/CDA1 family)